MPSFYEIILIFYYLFPFTYDDNNFKNNKKMTQASSAKLKNHMVLLSYI